MGFLDFIKSLFGNNKLNAKLIVDDFSKDYGDGSPLEVGLYEDDNPLKGKEIRININSRDYVRVTDEDGIARLNINLGVGDYTALISFNDDEYNYVSAYCKVYVNPVVVTNDLVMSYLDGSKFGVKVTDKNNKALGNVKVDLVVNGVEYNRVTDGDGYAYLGIKLNPNVYSIITKVAGIVKKNNITVNKMDTRMEGTDINKTVSEKSVYQCAVYDKNNNRVKGNVNIKVNGVVYNRNIGDDGLAKLNINLGKGEYNISSEFKGDSLYNGSKVENKIKVVDDPKPTPKPVKLHPYITEQGGGKLGQRTGYSCGPHSLMQCIYRLTGVELSESTLMSVCGTTTSGTDHQGLATGLAWFNRNYGYNLKMTWKDFSDVGWDKLQEYIDNGAVFIHLLYRNTWGHYEVPRNVDVVVLNSLGSSCGNGYCGYIESRSRSTQLSYINGISQKSICIITRG